MSDYSSLADDFYINVNLNTELQLPQQRETVLSFFERIKKSYPSMRNFYTRENGDYVLEDDKDQGHQRSVSMELRRICSYFLNPPQPEDALSQHQFILQLVPYMLSVSALDCEALDYMLAFEFNYRGNHDAIVAEALGTSAAVEGLLDIPGAQVLNFEPSVTISLDESCRLQARLMIETRTNAYQVKRGEYPEDHITVYFTVRQYGGLDIDASFESTVLQLRNHSEKLMEQHVIDHVLRPLAHAISTK